MREFEFEGYPSGDYESFCWDVDKDTYIKIKTQRYKDLEWTDDEIKQKIKNSMKYDKAIFHEGMFMIYPNDVIDKKDKVKQKILIECDCMKELFYMMKGI